MWPFSRKAAIRAEEFWSRESAKIFRPGYTDGLKEIVSKAGFPDVQDLELTALLLFITLSALRLVQLPEHIRFELAHRVYAFAEEKHGKEWRAILEEVSMQYLALFASDLRREKSAQFMPGTMTYALMLMTGKADETVVGLRLALIGMTLGLMKSEKEFFERIRIVA